MEPRRELAITLRVVPFEDRHRIVTALTEHHGLVTALARNAVQSRRFGGALDLFCASEWMVRERPGSDLLSLQEATARRGFEGLRKDLDRLSLASVWTDLILRLAPRGDTTREVFVLHSNALAVLDELPAGTSTLPLLNAYLLKALRWLGNQARWESCLGCEIQHDTLAPLDRVRPDVVQAGWLCPSCARADSRSDAASDLRHRMKSLTAQTLHPAHAAGLLPIRAAAALQEYPLYALSPEENLDLFGFLEGLFAYHVPGFDQRPLRGLELLGIKSLLGSAQSSAR